MADFSNCSLRYSSSCDMQPEDEYTQLCSRVAPWHGGFKVQSLHWIIKQNKMSVQVKNKKKTFRKHKKWTHWSNYLPNDHNNSLSWCWRGTKNQHLQKQKGFLWSIFLNWKYEVCYLTSFQSVHSILTLSKDSFKDQLSFIWSHLNNNGQANVISPAQLSPELMDFHCLLFD